MVQNCFIPLDIIVIIGDILISHISGAVCATRTCESCDSIKKIDTMEEAL